MFNLCLVNMMFQLLFHRSHQASLSVTLSGLFTSLSFDNANIMAANIFRENLVLRILMPKIIRISYSYVKFMTQLFSSLSRKLTLTSNSNFTFVNPVSTLPALLLTANYRVRLIQWRFFRLNTVTFILTHKIMSRCIPQRFSFLKHKIV